MYLASNGLRVGLKLTVLDKVSCLAYTYCTYLDSDSSQHHHQLLLEEQNMR